MPRCAPSSQKDYNITQDGLDIVPQSLRNTFISKIHLEFLQVRLNGQPAGNNAKNHAVIKIDLASDHGSYEAVRISMVPHFELASIGSDDGNQQSYKPGKLTVKLVKYRGRSDSSARTCELQLPLFTAGLPLDYILRTIVNFKLQNFYLVCLNDRYYGCRDFATQALYQLWCAGYVTPTIINTTPETTALPTNNAFVALGMRFRASPLGQPWVYPIDRGYFCEYRRVVTPDMPYPDTQKAKELRRQLES